ncbi:hypothetical protein [Intestinibacillus massiliensis]|uniref:hypothetical protein n=1 Tax=Intestinibacillus massiliensis TaxID=1871029 RepID=UPI000B35CEAB|nr:hypothetical protein [Intestinibacillus massiliensis]
MNTTTANQKLYRLVLAGLLCAVAIVIPIFSPVKIQLEPASFTLASHVAIFIAMFISPTVAVAVNLGATLGFFLAGFPIVVVMRAFSQVVFAFVGAKYIQKHPALPSAPFKLGTQAFSLLIGVLHAVCEVLIVLPFYFGGNMEAYAQRGFFIGVFMLVGVGTVIHSMVDFAIAGVIWKPLQHAIRPAVSAAAAPAQQ